MPPVPPPARTSAEAPEPEPRPRQTRDLHPHRFKIILALLLAMGGLALLLWPLIQSERQWRELHARGVLRVGIDPGWRPFTYDSGPGWQGFDAELAQEIGRRLQLRIQPDPVGYDAMYDALRTGRTDIGLSVIVPDPSRTADVGYTQSYFDAGPRLLASQAISDMESLHDRRVAVALGGDADTLLRFWERRVPGLTRLTLVDDEQTEAALASGQADAALIDVFALPLDAAARGWRISSPQPKPYVIAVRASDARLLRELNRVLAEMQADGTLASLAQRWVWPR